MKSRAQRLAAAGLDPPMTSAELIRIARERQIARHGRIIDPALEESPVMTPKAAIKSAQAINRSDLDVDELVIRVPMPATLTNSGRGRSRQWYALHNEKKRYWRQLDELQLTGFIEKPPRTPIGKATVRSLMTLGGRMDEDNAMARHKWVLDWLATRGYIRNDRLMSWAEKPTQVVNRDSEYTIELTITRAG